MEPEAIIENSISLLTTIIENDQAYPDNNRDEEEKLLNLIKLFLQDYNIVESRIIEFAEKVIKNRDFQDAFIKIITSFNPSLDNLFLFKRDGK